MADPPRDKEPAPLTPLSADLPEETIKAISSSRLPAGAAQAAPKFQLLRELGRDGESRLTDPRAVAVRADGWIFALDRPAQGEFRISGFPPADKTGKAEARFRKGGDDDELLDPVSLAVDSQQQLYVADAAANCVKRFSSDGRWLATFNSAGFDGSAFNGPRDVAVDPAGNLHVADAYNNRIVKLTADGELVWALERFAAPGGLADDEFYEPYSVHTDGKGLAVADTNNNRVVLFDAQRKVRAILGSKVGQFVFPAAVRLGRDGKSVSIGDHGNQRVRRIRTDGGPAATLTLTNRLDNKVAFAGGAALDIDAQGHIVLVHPQRGTIVVLDFLAGGS